MPAVRYLSTGIVTIQWQIQRQHSQQGATGGLARPEKFFSSGINGAVVQSLRGRIDVGFKGQAMSKLEREDRLKARSGDDGIIHDHERSAADCSGETTIAFPVATRLHGKLAWKEVLFLRRLFSVSQQQHTMGNCRASRVQSEQFHEQNQLLTKGIVELEKRLRKLEAHAVRQPILAARPADPPSTRKSVCASSSEAKSIECSKQRERLQSCILRLREDRRRLVSDLPINDRWDTSRPIPARLNG